MKDFEILNLDQLTYVKGGDWPPGPLGPPHPAGPRCLNCGHRGCGGHDDDWVV